MSRNEELAGLWAHHSANLIQHFLVCHGSAVLWIVPLPKEAGRRAPPLSHVLVQAVVSYVGVAALEPCVLDLAFPDIEIAGEMILHKLHSAQ